MSDDSQAFIKFMVKIVVLLYCSEKILKNLCINGEYCRRRLVKKGNNRQNVGMIRKDSVTLLQKAIESNKDFVKACLKENIHVICFNKETGKNKTMPFKVLLGNNNKFWFQNEVWEYYLLNEDYAKVLEAAKEKEGWSPDARAAISGESNAPVSNSAVEDGFGKEYKAIETMTDEERVRDINKSTNKLVSLITQKPRRENLVTEALVETTCYTVMHNHASLLKSMDSPDEEAKKQNQNLVDSTRELVKASTQLISANIFNDDLMNTLVAKSNGTIIQHMTRVYLNGLAFLTHYNDLVSSSSTIAKMRIDFERKYNSFYYQILPHIHPDYITLETTFQGGMRAVSEADFYNWAVGFLVHDIGKAAAVEYHEGEAAYNRDIVMEHVKVGYDSITHKTNYPKDACLITGYHHEYYGNEAGYGYYRSDLEKAKKQNPQIKPKWAIAYEIKPIENFEALGFFPAKVLEIIDVFDSVTDPNRKYRKAMTTEEALAMMREEFIIKHKKIDIIIFDIFSQFVRGKQAAS